MMAFRAVLALSLGATLAASLQAEGLRAGAARVDITPAKDEALLLSGYAARTEGHKGIHDNLYVRAIALHDGSVKAAIVVYDLIGVPQSLWEKLSKGIEGEFGIAPENLLLAGTHTHGAPALMTRSGELSDKQKAYVARVENCVIEALRNAQSAMQPARVGAGKGRANVNVNRRAPMADGSWWLGYNPDAPSDKTVDVVRFETHSGQPIAFFVNYPMHGTGMGQENYQITADVPGATARWVERHYNDNVVAVWTSGAAGDQAPIYDLGARGFNGVMAVGRILGEEVVRVAETVKTSPRASIRGAQKVVTCPGQRLNEGPVKRKPQDYKWDPADPVEIRLSVLMVDRIALGGVSGEVLNMVGQRLKKESRLPHTMMVTHCNGSSGYLPDEEAYKNPGYEIAVSRVRPGCAEDAVVNGLLELMGQRPRAAAKR